MKLVNQESEHVHTTFNHSIFFISCPHSFIHFVFCIALYLLSNKYMNE